MADNIYFKNEDLYKKDLPWSGASPSWESSQTYSINDVVFYNGILYFSRRNNNLNNTPENSPVYWRSRGKKDNFSIKSHDVKFDNDTFSQFLARGMAGGSDFLSSIGW